MLDLVAVFSRCRATFLSDMAGALSLAALLVVALHLPDLF